MRLQSLSRKQTVAHAQNAVFQHFLLTETKELIDELAETAELAGTDVEVLSGETEEGQMLKKSFGGVAAILRYKVAT